jgi:hypothetical protein
MVSLTKRLLLSSLIYLFLWRKMYRYLVVLFFCYYIFINFFEQRRVIKEVIRFIKKTFRL